MGRQWLLFEVLGDTPVVVAQGDRLRKSVPAAAYLRNNPNVRSILNALAQTTSRRRPLILHGCDGVTVIRTEPVLMSDGCVHGVHVWTGNESETPRPRPLPGAIYWDLVRGSAIDTPQALLNAGKDVSTEKTHGRTFAADMPIQAINDDESTVLAKALRMHPGEIYSSTWDLTGHDGRSLRASFVARTVIEKAEDGEHRAVCRAMNWAVEFDGEISQRSDLARSLVVGTTQEGVYRALVDLERWNLLKWVDAACPLFDWQGEVTDRPLVHPNDGAILSTMRHDFSTGPAEGVLRLRGHAHDWVQLHASVHRVHLEDDIYAGLVVLRVPTRTESSKLAPGGSGLGSSQRRNTDGPCKASRAPNRSAGQRS